MSAIQQALWNGVSSGGLSLPFTMDFSMGSLDYYTELGFTFVLSHPGSDSVSIRNVYSGDVGPFTAPYLPDTGEVPVSGDPPPTSGGFHLYNESYRGGSYGTLTINLPAGLMPTKVHFWGSSGATGLSDCTVRAYDALGNNAQVAQYLRGGGGVVWHLTDIARDNPIGVGFITKLVIRSIDNYCAFDDITFYA